MFWRRYWTVFHCGAAALAIAVLRKRWTFVTLLLAGLAAGIKVGQRDPSGLKIVASSEGNIQP